MWDRKRDDVWEKTNMRSGGEVGRAIERAVKPLLGVLLGTCVLIWMFGRCGLLHMQTEILETGAQTEATAEIIERDGRCVIQFRYTVDGTSYSSAYQLLKSEAKIIRLLREPGKDGKATVQISYDRDDPGRVAYTGLLEGVRKVQDTRALAAHVVVILMVLGGICIFFILPRL